LVDSESLACAEFSNMHEKKIEKFSLGAIEERKWHYYFGTNDFHHSKMYLRGKLIFL
jgi:hypothetical protein